MLLWVLTAITGVFALLFILVLLSLQGASDWNGAAWAFFFGLLDRCAAARLCCREALGAALVPTVSALRYRRAQGCHRLPHVRVRLLGTRAWPAAAVQHRRSEPPQPLPPRQRSFLELLRLRKPSAEEQEYDRQAAANPTPGPTAWYTSPVGVVVAIVVAIVLAWWIISAISSSS